MQSLAVKYRPSTFNSVVEQGAIKDILQEQIASKTHKNAYLFTGGAGTGKTTCARIFANELNGGKGNPIEIDAASNNGVDDVRDIRANAGFKSVDSEFKIYIIDECHMLSTGAWNAMLKLLEEPPARTIFIFCTTDPQKIPATILSRVQRYDFKRITFDAMLQRLYWILQEVNAELDKNELYFYHEDALHYICKIADGGMRDAITLLDKVMSYSHQITLDNVVTALGTVNYEVMFDLAFYTCMGAQKNVVEILETIHRDGIDLKQFVKQMLHFILDMAKYRLLASFDYLQIPSFYRDRLEAFSDSNYVFIKDTFLDAMLKLNSNIKWETVPKPLIQATFMLLCEAAEEEE